MSRALGWAHRACGKGSKACVSGSCMPDPGLRALPVLTHLNLTVMEMITYVVDVVYRNYFYSYFPDVKTEAPGS